MKRPFILLFIIILPFLSNAQSALERKASRAIYKFDYKTATEVYEEMLISNPENKIAKVNIANAYLAMGNYEKAELWFEKLAKGRNAPPAYKFNYAQMLMANGKYEEADAAFEDFASSAPNDSRSKFFKNNPNYIQALIKQLPQYGVSNIRSLNTIFSDMCAVNYQSKVIFSSARASDISMPVYDLFTATKTSDSTFTDISKMSKPFNSGLHDGPISFSNDESSFLMTRSFQKTGSCYCSNDKTNHIRLYQGNIANGETKNINTLELAEENFSIGHATLSADGNTLIFVSNQPGGFGESDLWMSTKKTGEWSKPVNMGKDVNTPGRELFPFLGADGTLYFSSDGRIGLGGLDVFSANRLGNVYTNVLNLGAPVNSSSDDFGFFLNKNKKTGYLTSNRPGGIGGDDIYFVNKADKMPFDAIVYDIATNEELLDAQVELINNTKKTLEIVNTDDFGVAKFLLDGNTSYRIKAKKDGYLAKQISFKTLNVIQEKQSVRIPIRREGGMILEVKVVDNEGQPLAGAGVMAIPKEEGKKVIGITGANGKATLIVQNDKTYKVKVTKSVSETTVSYNTVTAELSTYNQVPPFTFYQNFKLIKFVEGTITEIQNIYYDSRSYALKNEVMKELNKVVNFLERNPRMEIEVRSHTDSRGDDNENLILSKKRARIVADYIINKGISANRVQAEGYGETQLKNKCINDVQCTETEHQENRRTEFKLLKVK